jgi:hypothetical protein
MNMTLDASPMLVLTSVFNDTNIPVVRTCKAETIQCIVLFLVLQVWIVQEEKCDRIRGGRAMKS